MNDQETEANKDGASSGLRVSTGSLLRVWKSEYGTPSPVEKWCEKRGWPNRTTEGEIMYENVFFADLAKAWERHIAEHEAGFEMDTRRVKQAKADLSAAIAAGADTAILMCDVKLAHSDFLKANTRHEPQVGSQKPTE